jgi:hypothetical protein
MRFGRFARTRRQTRGLTPLRTAEAGKWKICVGSFIRPPHRILPPESNALRLVCGGSVSTDIRQRMAFGLLQGEAVGIKQMSRLATHAEGEPLSHHHVTATNNFSGKSAALLEWNAFQADFKGRRILAPGGITFRDRSLCLRDILGAAF